MKRGQGLITEDDLAQYEAKWREPLRRTWRDYEVVSAPPPSSGGLALIQLLKINDYAATLFDGVEHNSTRYVHLVAEIEKRVFADRAEFLGDPDFVDNQIDELLDESYLQSPTPTPSTRISEAVSLSKVPDSCSTTRWTISV